MVKRLKLIMFGAGLVGRRVLPGYVEKFDVIAIADNDTNKHGKDLLGVQIVHPSAIIHEEFDYIVITSTSISQIYDQLVALGVNPGRIKETAELKGLRFPWDAIIFLSFLITLILTSIAVFAIYIIS